MLPSEKITLLSILYFLGDPEKSYCVFLKRHTCYDLIPLSAKLVVFDVTLNVSAKQSHSTYSTSLRQL